jgi:hypothetical protein
MTTTEETDARKELACLKEGKGSVNEYVAKFKQLMDQTGYSAINLPEHLFSSISDDMLWSLANTDKKTHTLDELIATATVIDCNHRITTDWIALCHRKILPNAGCFNYKTSSTPAMMPWISTGYAWSLHHDQGAECRVQEGHGQLLLQVQKAQPQILQLP